MKKEKDNKMKWPKVTPSHGTSWYVKWLATSTIVVGAVLNSLELVPSNFYFMLTGTALWFISFTLLIQVRHEHTQPYSIFRFAN